MLLSLLRNNKQGSGAECPHPFGQGYTVGVGLGTFGQAGRGKSRYGGFRRSCSGVVRYGRYVSVCHVGVS